jgi:hypothetical protein
MKRLAGTFILCALTGGGCGSGRSVVYVPVKETEETVTEIHDTTTVEKLVPYHSERVTEEDSSRLANPYAWSVARWDGERLHHTLGIWPDAGVTVRIPERTVTKTTVKEVPVEVRVEVEKKLTLWQKFLLAAGGPALLACTAEALYTAWKRRKG